MLLKPWLKIIGLLYIRYLWDPESSTPNLASYPPSVCLSITISSFDSILRANASAGITKAFRGRCAERLSDVRRTSVGDSVSKVLPCDRHRAVSVLSLAW